MNTYVRYIVFCSLLFGAQEQYAALRMRGNSSAIRVATGATLVVDQTMNVINGTLIKEAGSIISGQNIVFTGGYLVDEDNNLSISAALDNTNQLLMTGNDLLRVKSSKVLQSVLVSGAGNRLEGQPLFSSPITLQDAYTDLILAVQSVLNHNIVLNGGTIILDDRLQFTDDNIITGSGSVDLNGNDLILGSKDLSWTSSIVWVNASHIVMQNAIDFSGTFTFSGINRIEGNGNILDLSAGGALVVDSNARLHLKNIIIKGIKDDCIRCVDNTSELVLYNVTWVQDQDYHFDNGSFIIQDEVILAGNGYTFAYQSSGTSTVRAESEFILDRGITFSYDPSGNANDLFVFEDVSSILTMNGATLYAMVGGIQLKKGQLHIVNNSSLRSTAGGAGITIGSGIESEDFCLKMAPSTQLSIEQGMVTYKNKGANSWKIDQADAKIRFKTGTHLYSEDNLDIGESDLYFEANTLFTRPAGKKIIGSVHASGTFKFAVS